MEDRERLRVIGITYNQIESGVYALILQEDSGTVRIPIIIGYPEAQSIECKLQDIATPRPLTHDIMARMLEEFNLTLVEVEIRKLPNGVFAADLTIEDSFGNRRVIDSRSSDGVALALRCNAPIYTSRRVIEEAGFSSENQKQKSYEERSRRQSPTGAESVEDPKESEGNDSRLRRMSVSELNRAMAQAAEKEDYESAARIKAELEKRRSSSERSEK